MTHQILTRFFVASLIILGEGAFTSEVNSRSDVAAASIGNIIQSLPTTFSDDPEIGSQLVITHPYLSPNNSPLTNELLDYSTFIAANATAYSPSNPRAPPFFV